MVRAILTMDMGPTGSYIMVPTKILTRNLCPEGLLEILTAAQLLVEQASCLEVPGGLKRSRWGRRWRSCHHRLARSARKGFRSRNGLHNSAISDSLTSFGPRNSATRKVLSLSMFD